MSHVRNQYKPEFLHNKSDLIANVDYQKARIRNLREQSPFHKGKRNPDFINPALTSNMIFYNYGKEKVSNPHYAPNKFNKPKGHDLNEYVVIEPQSQWNLNGRYSRS